MKPTSCPACIPECETESSAGGRSTPAPANTAGGTPLPPAAPLSPDDLDAIRLIVEYLCGRMRHLKEEPGSIDDIIEARGRPTTRLSAYHFPVYLWDCQTKRGHRMEAVIDQGNRRFSFHFRRAR